MSEVEQITAHFIKADTDKSGTLSVEELVTYLKSKGQKEADIRAVFAKADVTNDKAVSLKEFLIVMGAGTPEEQRRASLIAVCSRFDKDGSGTIDKSELVQVWKEEFGRVLTCDEQAKVIGEADTDGSGTIDYQELIKRVFNSNLNLNTGEFQ